MNLREIPESQNDSPYLVTGLTLVNNMRLLCGSIGHATINAISHESIKDNYKIIRFIVYKRQEKSDNL